MDTIPLTSRAVVEIPRAPSPDLRTPSRGVGQSHENSAVTRPDSPSRVAGLFERVQERVQARVRPDDLYREEIVRSIFGDVGTTLEDFSCAVVSRILLHGRMYVTATFVCFYSNVFGFEKTIKIPFCHMRCITKEKTALFIPNAIAIITSKKEYVFRSFWDRDDAFNTLKLCHQNSLSHPAALEDSPALLREPASAINHTLPSRETEPEQNRRLLKHSSSSGGRGSDKDSEDKGLRPGHGRRILSWRGRSDRRRTLSAGTDDAVGEQHNRSLSGASSNASGSSFQATESIAAEPRDAVNLDLQRDEGGTANGDGRRATEREAAGGEEIAVAVEDGSASPGTEGVEGGRASIGVDESDPCDDSEVDVLGVEGKSVDAVSLGSTMGGGVPHSKAEEFKLALAALGDGYPVGDGSGDQSRGHRNSAATVRIEAELPCLLKNFFELFFANDAEKGLPAFHEAQGDSDVQATLWKVAGGDLGMTREIRFVHPLSAPIGPSRTRAVKLQRCRLYDEHGLIIETSTHLEDIVMSDYFQIEDRCVVQPGIDGGVRIDVEVQIKFLKSTMFRKTIETKSLTETKEVWESFVVMAKDAIQARQPVLPQALSTGGEESDDEGRVRMTRERLRERRKHRQRNRPPHHPHDRVPDEPGAAPSKNGSSRPRAKSAAARVQIAPLVERGLEPGGRGGAGGARKGSGATASGVSVRATPIPSLLRWLFSFAALPWILLASVFVVEMLQYLRFSGEAAGFLEASEVALSVLAGNAKEGGVTDGDGMCEVNDEEWDGTEGAGVAVPVPVVVAGTVLRRELARGLVEIYVRNRFFWPFNRLL